MLPEGRNLCHKTTVYKRKTSPSKRGERIMDLALASRYVSLIRSSSESRLAMSAFARLTYGPIISALRKRETA